MPPLRGFLDGENGSFLLRFRPAGAAVGWLVCVRPVSIRGEALKGAFLTHNTFIKTISGTYSVTEEGGLMKKNARVVALLSK